MNDPWRTSFHTVNGFSRFCRDWQTRGALGLSVLTLRESFGGGEANAAGAAVTTATEPGKCMEGLIVKFPRPAKGVASLQYDSAPEEIRSRDPGF